MRAWPVRSRCDDPDSALPLAPAPPSSVRPPSVRAAVQKGNPSAYFFGVLAVVTLLIIGLFAYTLWRSMKDDEARAVPYRTT